MIDSSLARWILVAAAIMGATGVILGSISAHGLVKILESNEMPSELIEKRVDQFEVGVRYQMYHAIGMILVGIVSLFRNSKSLNIAGWCFWFGITLFSGLLYILVLTEIRILGAIVPLGGLSFIAGWVCFAIGSCCLSRDTVGESFVTLTSTKE